MLLCYKHILGLCLLSILLGPQGSRGQANLRRCFTCRSRGEKGDCRDSFIRPQPPPTELKEGEEAPYVSVVDETPCATGWCAKIIEGVGIDSVISEDYGIATERQCMTRAPSDNKERCAYVVYRGKQVFMCFCKGDLCNSGDRTSVSLVTMAAVVSFSLVMSGIFL